MLKDKNVLITGASSGLGEHFARLVANQGATRIALAARRRDRLEKLKEEILKSNTNEVAPIITCISLDTSDVSSIRCAFESLENEWKVPADVVVNNAGVSIPNSFLNVTEKEYDDVIDVNLKGAFFVCQEAAKRMVQAKVKGGSIINISSILGLRVGKDLSAYAVTKAGVIHMTKAAAMELSRYDIRVNCVCPGYIETEMNTSFFQTEKGKEMISKRMLAKRLGQPDELDGAILLLASNSSSFMNGSIITVDGGHVVGSI